MANYPRDLVGYGPTPPNAAWPNGARVAVQFVLNYEEGAENCILHGDPASEVFLSEIIGAAAFEGARHMSMESIYEYGSRSGVWRLLDLFRDRGVPLTLFAVAMAMERHPAVIEQALADMTEFLNDKERLLGCAPGENSCKSVLFGGSYGGMLAAWHRLKYPFATSGALAASAPVDLWPGEGKAAAFRAASLGVFAKFGGATGEACAAPSRAAPAPAAPFAEGRTAHAVIEDDMLEQSLDNSMDLTGVHTGCLVRPV